MPNVRQVFERAYGAIPEGATCHIGWASSAVGCYFSPTTDDDANGTLVWAQEMGWTALLSDAGAILGDISDQPAEAFSPVFQCEDYDAALDALKKEEGPDPRTVIALADVTVKDVFLKAYIGGPPEPEQMACYVGAHDDPMYGLLPVPMMYCVTEDATQDGHDIFESEMVGHYFAWTGDDEGWIAEDAICASTMQTDEITNLPAYAFSPVFKCELYDKALRELTEQKAKDSIHPDEIIKIANALAKFVLEGTGTNGVTVEDFANYYLKASGAYERLSQGGK